MPRPVIALVGYTNAGKSTLFNRLTFDDVTAKDQLFATLDPTMRALKLPSGRNAILSDTVGFVSNLPHELVQAFHATLEEVIEADIIIHVRDVAHPDTEAQKADVLTVLSELQVLPAPDEAEAGKPLLEALNKIDMLDEEERIFVTNRARIGNMTAIPISAWSGEGCTELMAAVDEILARGYITVRADLDFKDGAALAWLHERAEILERHDEDDGIHLDVRIAPDVAARFEKTFERQLRQLVS